MADVFVVDAISRLTRATRYLHPDVARDVRILIDEVEHVEADTRKLERIAISSLEIAQALSNALVCAASVRFTGASDLAPLPVGTVSGTVEPTSAHKSLIDARD